MSFGNIRYRVFQPESFEISGYQPKGLHQFLTVEDVFSKKDSFDPNAFLVMVLHGIREGSDSNWFTVVEEIFGAVWTPNRKTNENELYLRSVDFDVKGTRPLQFRDLVDKLKDPYNYKVELNDEINRLDLSGSKIILDTKTHCIRPVNDIIQFSDQRNDGANFVGLVAYYKQY